MVVSILARAARSFGPVQAGGVGGRMAVGSGPGSRTYLGLGMLAASAVQSVLSCSHARSPGVGGISELNCRRTGKAGVGVV